MTVSAQIVAELIAAGIEGDALVAALRRIEEAPSAGARRTRAYRKRRGISETEWLLLCEVVKERDKHTCQYCGATERLSVDHVVPLIKGGTNDTVNLKTACMACNGGKSGKSLEEWRAH